MPSLTFVLASTGPADDIVRVGAKLARQAARSGAEMIVAVPDDMVRQLSALRDIPDLRIVAAPSGSDRGALCAMAMQAASGDVVAFRDASQWRESLAADVTDHAEQEVTSALLTPCADRPARRTPIGGRSLAPLAAASPA